MLRVIRLWGLFLPMGRDLRSRPPQLISGVESNVIFPPENAQKQTRQIRPLAQCSPQKRNILNDGWFVEEWLVVDDMIFGFHSWQLQYGFKFWNCSNCLSNSFSQWSFEYCWVWWDKKFQLVQRLKRIGCKYAVSWFRCHPLVLFWPNPSLGSTF